MAAVLLVEDDTHTREILCLALEMRGLEVRTAASDEQAYAALDQDAHRLAVLVADINLGPGTTGFDIARRARRLKPGIAVMFISGEWAFHDRHGVENAAMFLKPFSPDELAKEVERLTRA